VKGGKIEDCIAFNLLSLILIDRQI
jgi:hypothetical protein